MTPLHLAEEEIVFRADRTLFWPRRRTLVIADPHFGKAESFRAFGVPVPGGPEESLARIDGALLGTKAERLIVLGDYWHDRAGRNDAVVERLAAWRVYHSQLDVELVRGNHDRAGPPPDGWGRWRDDPWPDPPFVFAHRPVPSAEGFVLAGHVHPGVVIPGVGRQRVRVPCFRVGAQMAVLPAFGSFTGMSTSVVEPGERIFAIACETVFEVPAWHQT